MSLMTALIGILIGAALIVMILFVLFGQVTVRKLRKNPETKNELGMEFVSGWDILNVASALAMPKWINEKLKDTPLSSLYADTEILYKHTNRFDRVLAKIFYGLFILTGFSGILVVVLDKFGVLD